MLDRGHLDLIASLNALASTREHCAWAGTLSLKFGHEQRSMTASMRAMGELVLPHFENELEWQRRATFEVLDRINLERIIAKAAPRAAC